MARGLLVTYSGCPVTLSVLMPDSGLASLAGMLQAHGHEVLILDLNTVSTLGRLISPARALQLSQLHPRSVDPTDQGSIAALLELQQQLDEDVMDLATTLAEELAVQVGQQGSHFVGFKLWNGTGFRAAVAMAEQLRRRFPRLKLYGGGPAVLFAGQTIFAYTQVFDALVLGEGEPAILGLARHAAGQGELSEVPNLILLQSGQIHHTPPRVVRELNDLPAPAYAPQIYPSLAGDEQLKVFTLDESRGCPNRCNFCITRSLDDGKSRTKTPQRVVQEIQDLITFHNSRGFRLGGNYVPRHWLEQFATQVLEQQAKLSYVTFFNHRRKIEDAGLLRRSGCAALFFGVESFVVEDLIHLNKWQDTGSAQEEIRTCLAVGIVPAISLIVPAPGQQPASITRNQQILEELCAGEEAMAMVQFPALLPNTFWFARLKKHGFTLGMPPDVYRLLMALYKVRHLLPPTLWEPLPYSLDGRPFVELTGITVRFQQALRQADVLVNMTEELVIIARHLGRSLREIKADLDRAFLCLDAQAIGEFVRSANTSLSTC